MAELTPEQRAALARRLAQRRAAAAPDRIPRRDPHARVPLTPAQRALWLLGELNPSSVAYNHLMPFTITGPLLVDALVGAVHDVVARHESLRSLVTVDGSDGVPYVDVVGAADAATDVVVESCDAAASETRLREFARDPFVLTRDLPLRALVLRHDERHHTVGIHGHHIALDNLSCAILARELQDCYAARVAGGDRSVLAEPELQYGDYAAWLTSQLDGPRGAELDAFWTRLLRDVPRTLELPLDRARPAMQTFDGGRVPIAADAQTVAALHAAARAGGVTPFMLLFSVFAAVLYRWSGQAAFAIGTPIANRDRVELEGVVGFVNNTLAIPVDLTGNPAWRDALAGVKQTLVDAFGHAELPFERVVHALNPPRDLARNPIFQVNFRVAPGGERVREVAGTRWERFTIDLRYAKFDLALELHVRDDGLGGHVEYNTALFEEATAAALAAAYVDALQSVCQEPDRRLLTLPAAHNARPTAPARSMRRRT